MKKPKTLIYGLWGLFIGFINGSLGAGGGMLAVPLLKKAGFSQKQSHQNAIAIILPITLISAITYIAKDLVTVKDAFIYIPTGILGAVIGTYLLKRISPKWIKYIFGALMTYAGIRLLLK